MIRKIVCIDEMKCTGCGECAMACHEGAIAMIGGKAKLIRDDYCDGLGDCLPSCPAGAITALRERKRPVRVILLLPAILQTGLCRSDSRLLRLLILTVRIF